MARRKAAWTPPEPEVYSGMVADVSGDVVRVLLREKNGDEWLTDLDPAQMKCDGTPEVGDAVSMEVIIPEPGITVLRAVVTKPAELTPEEEAAVRGRVRKALGPGRADL